MIYLETIRATQQKFYRPVEGILQALSEDEEAQKALGLHGETQRKIIIIANQGEYVLTDHFKKFKNITEKYHTQNQMRHAKTLLTCGLNYNHHNNGFSKLMH
jgi:hypothetical protein